MGLIKNNTPYDGKIKFKFEKYPHYTSFKCGVLNKLHLDFGFTKLVSRVIPEETINGFKVNKSKVELVNKYTGGIISTYKFKSNCTDCPDDDFLLYNTFMSNKGVFIGGVEVGWWYYNNNLKVCDNYPNGVAEKYDLENLNGEEIQVVYGYYGYTHRGGCLYLINDRYFTSRYIPKEKDYEEWEWSGYVNEYNRILENAKKENNQSLIKELEKDGVKTVIPFNRRGKKTIQNLRDAKRSAINLSKYLS